MKPPGHRRDGFMGVPHLDFRWMQEKPNIATLARYRVEVKIL
jgi:hypothetical protein